MPEIWVGGTLVSKKNRQITDNIQFSVSLPTTFVNKILIMSDFNTHLIITLTIIQSRIIAHSKFYICTIFYMKSEIIVRKYTSFTDQYSMFTATSANCYCTRWKSGTVTLYYIHVGQSIECNKRLLCILSFDFNVNIYRSNFGINSNSIAIENHSVCIVHRINFEKYRQNKNGIQSKYFNLLVR